MRDTTFCGLAPLSATTLRILYLILILILSIIDLILILSIIDLIRLLHLQRVSTLECEDVNNFLHLLRYDHSPELRRKSLVVIFLMPLRRYVALCVRVRVSVRVRVRVRVRVSVKG